MATQGVLQKDGTRCRKGATCKRHGAAIAAAQWEEKKKSYTRPKDLSPWYEEELEDVTVILRSSGFTGKTVAPYWSEAAVTYGLVEVECHPGTSLVVAAPSMYHPNLPRNVFYIWMVKNGVTVGVLKLMAQKVNQPITSITPETAISCIEIREEHRGKRYAQELIKLTEQHLISTKIHSGGHYTPEGFKALAGKLPYTKQALEEKDYGLMGVGIHFNSMTFVEDWDNFFLK